MGMVISIVRPINVGLLAHSLWWLWVAAEVALYGICQYSVINAVVCVIIGAAIERRIWRWVRRADDGK